MRAWIKRGRSLRRACASRVIFIEWVDTHYFALRGPYGGGGGEEARSCLLAARIDRSRVDRGGAVWRIHIRCVNDTDGELTPLARFLDPRSRGAIPRRTIHDNPTNTPGIFSSRTHGEDTHSSQFTNTATASTKGRGRLRDCVRKRLSERE